MAINRNFSFEEVTDKRNWPFPLPKTKSYTIAALRTQLRGDAEQVGKSAKERKYWLSSFSTTFNNALGTLPAVYDVFADHYQFILEPDLGIVQVSFDVTIFEKRDSPKRVFHFTFTTTG